MIDFRLTARRDAKATMSGIETIRTIERGHFHNKQSGVSGEIACIVSHPDYRGGKRGQRLLALLEQEARRLGLARVFVLTTQTAHWFIEQGFIETSRDDLPGHKQALYNLQRNSKVFFKTLT